MSDKDAGEGRRTSSTLVRLTVAVSVLSGMVTLLVPHLLTGPPAMNGSAKGTALVVVLGGAPVLLLAHRRARGGSVAALAMAAGAAAYLVYNAVLLLFATPFNRAFLLYEAMLGLAIWTLVSIAFDIRARAHHLGRPAGRWVAGFMFGVVLLNLGAWMGRVVPAVLSDRPGSVLTGTGLTTNPVYVQDLAFWLPAVAWLAVGTWRADPVRTTLGAAALCYWVLESASIAVDQWWGHHADPASSVVSLSVVPLFVIVGAVTIWPLASLLKTLRSMDGPWSSQSMTLVDATR